jgi:Recombinase
MYRQVKGPSGSKYLGGPSLVGGALMSLARPGAALADLDLDTFLAPSHASNSGHDWPMVRGETSSRRRGKHGALANKRAADSRANALASTLRELRAAGFISRRALADELNRAGLPTARGGRWHYTTVVRMLKRLGLLTWGKGAKINHGQANKHAADVRAKALAPTIAKLRKAGFVSIRAMARELNKQEIPTTQGGKWHPSSMCRLLQRLKRLEASSRTSERGH